MRFSSEAEDPITFLLKPPTNETLQQREVRLHNEAEAKRVSDQIDEGIKAERALWKKRKETTKLLLLGQSESGTSPPLYCLLVPQLTAVPSQKANPRH